MCDNLYYREDLPSAKSTSICLFENIDILCTGSLLSSCHFRMMTVQAYSKWRRIWKRAFFFKGKGVWLFALQLSTFEKPIPLDFLSNSYSRRLRRLRDCVCSSSAAKEKEKSNHNLYDTSYHTWSTAADSIWHTNTSSKDNYVRALPDGGEKGARGDGDRKFLNGA